VELPLQYIPYIILGAGVVTAIIILYFKFVEQRRAPTREPKVGDFKIHLLTREGIKTFEGELYYYMGIVKQRHFPLICKYFAGKGNPKTVTEKQVQTFLTKVDKWHKYAMRAGMTKIAFLSKEQIEASPFSLPEGDPLERGFSLATSKRSVIAVGDVGPEKYGGFRPVGMIPLDLKKMQQTLPAQQSLDVVNIASLMAKMGELGPLAEEFEAVEEQRDIYQEKFEDAEDQISKLTDQVTYWREEAGKKGITEGEEAPFRLPRIKARHILYSLIGAIAGAIFTQYYYPRIDTTSIVGAGIGFFFLTLIGIQILRKTVWRRL